MTSKVAIMPVTFRADRGARAGRDHDERCRKPIDDGVPRRIVRVDHAPSPRGPVCAVDHGAEDAGTGPRARERPFARSVLPEATRLVTP
jgi:hypothetical protein